VYKRQKDSRRVDAQKPSPNIRPGKSLLNFGYGHFVS